MSTQKPIITSPHVPDLAQLREWLLAAIAARSFADLVEAVVVLVTRMLQLNLELTKQLAAHRRARPKSETLDALERQLALAFVKGVARSSAPDDQPKDEDDEKKKKRRGRSPGRHSLPAHLRRIEMPNPLPESMRRCPHCGAKLTIIGHERCETLDIIPAELVVRVRVDETGKCPHDDTLVSSPPPPAIVPKGKLADTLIVEATCDKFIEHLPIERQCSRWASEGVRVAPQTVGRSVSALLDLLKPVAEAIHERTRGPGMLATDATSIPVLDPEAPLGIRNGTVWCWTNACWVSFFYSPKGDSESVLRFLDDALGRDVQCDGTSVTNCVEKAGGKRPGCLAHGRRYFVEAARSGDQIALEAIRIMGPLFFIEQQSLLAGDDSERRLARRQRDSAPIVEQLRVWADAQRGVTPPKTPLGKALRYLHRQWARLTLFLTDGNIELTNNRRERELRRLVLGRKNWLFTWLDSGAERTSTALTIIATCIAHGVDPRAYLHAVTKRLVHLGFVPDVKSETLRVLLPDRMLAAHPELAPGAVLGGDLRQLKD
jgi:transposase